MYSYKNIFGMGLLVRYASVPNKKPFFRFFQEIQRINAVLALFDVARQITEQKPQRRARVSAIIPSSLILILTQNKHE